MQTTVASSNPHFQSRAGAIVHLAVFEAVNAIGGDYEPYLGTIVAPPWASPEAAAVAAAHRTLITLYPGSAMTLNAARTASLAAIPDGPAEDAGIAAGEAAASAMLQLRANDGSAQANSVPYTPGTEPGEWRPIPSNGVPSLPGRGQAELRAGQETERGYLTPPGQARYSVRRYGPPLSGFRPWRVRYAVRLGGAVVRAQLEHGA
ncbi:MAG TPA: hypothetical protein VM490_06080, partial [Armatimonadaceae bacterium]|nr:hypothetical protein [Armatimonadaceae bacterium]